MTTSSDSHTNSDQVERLEVVESGRRAAEVRGREAEDRTGELGGAAPSLGDSKAVRHCGITVTPLLQWRRSFRPERNEVPERSIGFVPAVVGSESEPGRQLWPDWPPRGRSRSTGSPETGAGRRFITPCWGAWEVEWHAGAARFLGRRDQLKELSAEGDPLERLAKTVARIADHPVSRLDELLAWNWKRAGQVMTACAV